MVLLQTLLEESAPALAVWGSLLLVAAAGVAAAWLAHRVLGRVESAPGWLKHRASYALVLAKAVHPLLVVAVFLVVFWGLLRGLAVRTPSVVLDGVERLVWGFAILLVAIVVVRLVNGLLRRRAELEPRWRPAATLGIRLLDIVIFVVAFIIILAHYDVEITPLLASLGIAGLAVALALQDTLSNFFAGIWIQTGRYLKPGHYVRLEGHALEGYVEDVGWRTSKIRTLPGNYVILPNSLLAQSIVTDFHLPTPMMSLLISVSVGYESDPDQVERILIEECINAAEYTPGLLKDPAPFVRFIPGFGQTSLDFTLICKVSEFVDQFLAQHNVRKRLIARFRREGIRIPFPIRDIHLVPGDRADVASPSRPPDAAPSAGGPPRA